MKSISVFSKFLVIIGCGLLFTFTSCKKDESTPDDFSSESQEISQDEEISSSIDNAIAEAAALNGNGFINERNGNDPNSELSNCAAVTFDSLQSVMTITFSHCPGRNGHIRNGQIVIQFTNGGYWDVGASWDVTFVNFTINNNPVTGTRHVENVGPASNGMTWNINSNLTMTRGNGSTRTWTSTRTREITQGYGDPVRTNHIYRINGTASFADSQSGKSASIIITNVIRDLSCAYITAGTLEITPHNNQVRLVDFGSGVCDDVATVTKNGVTRIIHLRPR